VTQLLLMDDDQGQRVLAVERPKAEGREKVGKAIPDPSESFARVDKGRTVDKVGEAVGMSGRTQASTQEGAKPASQGH